MRYLAHHTVRLARLALVLRLPMLAAGVLAPAIARADNTVVVVSSAKQAALEACNALSKGRTSSTPAPQTAAPTQAATVVATQAVTTQTPPPSPTPRPAPTQDRVGFPDGFQDGLHGCDYLLAVQSCSSTARRVPGGSGTSIPQTGVRSQGLGVRG